jgi:uncharacterized OB-fold protein
VARFAVKPVEAKLLSIEDGVGGGWSLSGNRCLDCREVFHPPRYRCAKCTSPRLEPVELKHTGTVISYTQVHQTHPESLVPVPYWLALISLDDGPTIEAIRPTTPDVTEPQVGGRVRLRLLALQETDAEDGFVAYAFHEITGSEVGS